MSKETQSNFKRLARMCGVYPIARKMCNEGYTIETALEVLVGKKVI
jgi:hypothetical protein